MNERDAFTRQILADPSDTTTRLVFADWLVEHDESGRAELIRWQIETGARLTSTNGPCVWIIEGATGDVSAACWRAAGAYIPLLAPRPFTVINGFPVVTCRLGDVASETTVTRFRGPGATNPYRADVWEPTSWALLCVRDGVTFAVADREPMYGGNDGYAWMRGMDDTALNRLPEVIWDELKGVQLFGLSWKVFESGAAARAALDRAVTALVARAAFQEVQLTRPVCRRCKRPLLLVPVMDPDQPGEWELDCPGGWDKSAWQSDETFWAAWDNLPGDEVVRLEKKHPEVQS